MSDFITMCIDGKAAIHEIDDYIERWHESGTVSLSEYLGMNKLEYKLWVADASTLTHIIASHKAS